MQQLYLVTGVFMYVRLSGKLGKNVGTYSGWLLYSFDFSSIEVVEGIKIGLGAG